MLFCSRLTSILAGSLLDSQEAGCQEDDEGEVSWLLLVEG
jgi:hypothetical protein